jgi:two-component system sensor histidine kinase VanS
VDRAPGLSVRAKLTLSYAGFLVVAGGTLIVVAWVVLLRRLPDVGVLPGGEVLQRSVLERNLAVTAGLMLVFLALVGLAGGWLLAGRMLAPLARITDATRQAATGSLSHRIQLPGSQDEFHELADAFDSMLEQLEAHVAEQERFAANASHELRTPLAITQSLLDVAHQDPHPDTDQFVERLRDVNTRAITLTEALLLLSRANRRTFAREHVDLSLLAEEATETLLTIADKRGVAINTSAEPAPTVGSPTLLSQLTMNLVHNAIVHNAPEHGTVWVTTTSHADDVELAVDNTGETLDPQRVSTLVEPFQRGSERTHTDHSGVGLGLAIVDSITRAHDGTLTLTPRDGGGLHVTVRLPTASTPRPIAPL